jgi:hypothetical protein
MQGVHVVQEIRKPRAAAAVRIVDFVGAYDDVEVAGRDHVK